MTRALLVLTAVTLFLSACNKDEARKAEEQPPVSTAPADGSTDASQTHNQYNYTPQRSDSQYF